MLRAALVSREPLRRNLHSIVCKQACSSFRLIINPKVNAHQRVMPYACGNSIHPTGDSMPILWIGQKKDRSKTVFFLSAPPGTRICRWHIRRSAWEYELNRTNAEGYAQTDRTLAGSRANCALLDPMHMPKAYLALRGDMRLN